MRTVVIAEAGVNHNADMQLAKRMVEAAKEAGADFVKFQTAIPEMVISSLAPKAEYQKETTGLEESQLEMCRKLHFPHESYIEIKEWCERCGIGFLSTPFDIPSLKFLDSLGMEYIKIPSGEITNLPLLRAAAATGRKIILSTGMSTMTEVSDAIEILTGTHRRYRSVSSLTKDDITVLQCNTQYPTPYSDVNLLAMVEMRRQLGVKTGYSDHTLGIEVPVAAVALGARLIEKHFTLSRSLPGPDQRASLEPEELTMMIRFIRHVEDAMGSSEKVVTESERANIAVARKSIVAARDIRKGEIFTEENLTVKRPGNGLSPLLIDDIIGREASRDYPYDSLIEE